MKNLATWIFTGLLLATGQTLATRPLTLNDTELVEAGKFQIEKGGLYQLNSADRHFDSTVVLLYGFEKVRMDIGVGWGIQYEKRTDGNGTKDDTFGITDLTIYPRWKFAEESGNLPSQAVSFAIKLPTASHSHGLGTGKTDFDLTWIASKKITEKSLIDANLGYTLIGKSTDEDTGNVLHYGAAFEYQFSEKWQGVAEVFAQKETHDSKTTAQFDAGLRWQARDNITLDIAAGTKICGEAPDVSATAGLTWAFGPGKKKEKS